MLHLYLDGLPAHLESGIADFFAMHHIKEDKNGLCVHIEKSDDNTITVEKNGRDIVCRLERPYQIFRALTLILENAEKAAFCLQEKSHLKTLAAMFDGSQASSLMTVESCKKMMLYLAGMGYNMVMLYCEDCFELESEPYWGNMRPRYTKADFRALDDYAYALGIEMIPCIQTLAHLTDALKRLPYKPLADTTSVMMVGDERVYELIEKIIAGVSSCFRSKRIHIGMDEAWDLGFGNYYKKNGYVPSGEIIKQHLSRVNEIIKKYGLSPMMWSDMFFRARSKTRSNKDYTVEFLPEDKESIPDNMYLVYWDYYQNDKAGYDNMLGKNLYLTEKTIFAGCARNVRTFASHNEKTFVTATAALASCKDLGVREVIATVWGDDHRESSTFATLLGLQLFGELAYRDEPTREAVRARLKTCTGLDATVFDHIDALDACPAYNGNNLDNVSLTRAFIWQDPMMGLFDKDTEGYDFSAHYEALAEKLREDAAAHPIYEKMLLFYHHVAIVIAIKANLGHKLYAAYTAKDRAALQALLTGELPKLYKALQALRLAHRAHFFEEYKPIGWEILDIRYGGALMRVDTTIARLTDYLDGRIAAIEELEEERLHYGAAGKVPPTINYNQICSASRL